MQQPQLKPPIPCNEHPSQLPIYSFDIDDIFKLKISILNSYSFLYFSFKSNIKSFNNLYVFLSKEKRVML